MSEPRRPARNLCWRGHTYVPRDPPSKFTVGPGAWLKDEGDLRVAAVDPYTIRVAAPDDPQILFPPAEIWVRPGRYEHLLEDDLVD